ncbi:MAG: NUDIX hydrolase [Bacillota bacterium]
MENQVFGEKLDGLDYQKRKGVYAVIFNSAKNKVVTVQTTRGHYFLPGGGIEANEKNEDCLKREVLEETGYGLSIGSFVGKAMKYFQSTKNEPILSEGYFYFAELLNKIQNPIEDDHFLKWISVENIEEFLIHEHHNWAVKEGLKKIN